jgi:hypothetical protein
MSDWVRELRSSLEPLKHGNVRQSIMENGTNSKKRPGVEMKRREGKADSGLPHLEGPASRDGCSNPVSRAGH